MILPLRRRHRRVFAIIATILPIVLTAGIAARKTVPTSTLPRQVFPGGVTFTVQQWDRSDLFTKTPVHVRLLREAVNIDRFAVELSAAKDFVKADLLVYWLPANSTITDTIPDQAILLGGFNSGLSMPVPLVVVGKPGTIVLYSLADNEIVAVSQSVTL